MTTYDQDALNSLTPEEQAAIQDGEYTEQEQEAIKQIASSTDEDQDEEEESQEEQDDEAKPEGDLEETPEAKERSKANPEEEEKPQAPPQQSPYTAAPLDDFEAKSQALVEQEKAVWQRFDDGELDRDGLQKELRVVEQQRSTLNTAHVKSEISQEMAAQHAQQQWKAAVDVLVESAKADGIDYRGDAAKAQDLDGFVKALANNDANAGKPMQWFLAEAHKRVQALHGIKPTTTAENVASLKDAAARRKQTIEKAPKTLAQVPGSSGPGDVGDQFSDVDTLEGDELETAIAKMTPAQRTKYAAG